MSALREAVDLEVDLADSMAFAHRLMSDMAGALTGAMCVLGERLGLFRLLASEGPLTGEELAGRAGIGAAYARGWLEALACAGYLDHEGATGSFSLPPARAAVLAGAGGPFDMSGAFSQLPALQAQLDALTEAFRSGEGLPQSSYRDEMWEGMERISARWFDHMLVQQWIPQLPELQARLERGARVADVGCGGGRALVQLALAFPRSSFVGYDCFETAVERARSLAERCGVDDRVSFERKDVLDGVGARYDLVTAFDSVHDFVDPLAGLCALRECLLDEGRCLILEVNRQDDLSANAGPVGTILHATSVLYGIPVSLSNGGDGRGTTGIARSRLESLFRQAGFSESKQVPTLDPFNVLFDLRR